MNYSIRFFLYLAKLTLFILSVYQVEAQSHLDWQWVKDGKYVPNSDKGQRDVESVTVDEKGQIHIYGNTDDSIFVDGFQGSPKEDQEHYITRFDKEGNLILAQFLEGKAYSASHDLDVDENGNIYVVSEYEERRLSLVSEDTYYYDIGFLAKYDSLGTLLWYKSFNSPSSAIHLELSENQIYVIGKYTHRLKIDDDSLIADSRNSANIFIAKFDRDGSLLNLEGFRSNFYIKPTSLAVGKKYVYVGGWYINQLYFETDTITAPHSRHDFFVAQYSKDGFEFQWVRHGQSKMHKVVSDIIITPKDEAIALGDLELKTSALQYEINGDIYWASIPDSDFVALSYKSASIDTLGNIFLVGSLRGKLSFNEGVSVEADLIKAQPVIVKLDSNGNALWAEIIPGHGGHGGFSYVELMPDESLYLHGSYESHLEIDGQVFTREESYFHGVAKENLSVGNREELLADEVKIYPNPAREELFIENTNQSNTAIEYHVYDMTGKFLMGSTKISYPAGKALVKVATGELSTGLYLLHIKKGDQIVIRKFVKE